MANEINIQAALALQKASGSLQGISTGTANSPTTGIGGILNVQSVSAAEAAINIGNVSFTTAGFLFVKNLDTSIAVEVGVQFAGTGSKYYFAKLRGLEFCLIPISPASPVNVYFAKAASGTPFIQVAAVEAT